jgi:hypothetical protein
MRRKVLPKKVKASKTVTVYHIRIVPDNEPYEMGDAEDVDEVNAAIDRDGVWGFIIEQRQERGAFHTDWTDLDDGINSVWGFIGAEFCLEEAVAMLPKDAVYTVSKEF